MPEWKWFEMDGQRELQTKNTYNSFREVLLQIRAEVSPKIDLREIIVFGFKTGNFFH